MNSPKVMIVTGASKGIGLATAQALAARGVLLGLCARSTANLEALATEYPEHIYYEAIDVGDATKSQGFLQRTVERFGRLDTLINNAGVLGPVGSTTTIEVQALMQAMQTNFAGALSLAQAALPHLRASGGRLINLSSGAAQQALPMFAAYCCTKAPLAMLTAVLALEEPDITAINFVPGVVDTAMQESIRRQGVPILPSPWKEYFSGLASSGALTTPSEVGNILAWTALSAPHSWSGKQVCADNPDIRAHALSAMGLPPEVPPTAP